ncbi:MAG TPA: hypothetical protein VF989_18030 [Polyangiaceae bacterium]
MASSQDAGQAALPPVPLPVPLVLLPLVLPPLPELLAVAPPPTPVAPGVPLPLPDEDAPSLSSLPQACVSAKTQTRPRAALASPDRNHW